MLQGAKLLSNWFFIPSDILELQWVLQFHFVNQTRAEQWLSGRRLRMFFKRRSALSLETFTFF